MSTESAEAPEITFVAGRAVEQVEPQDSNLEPDEREAAKKAVREAIEKAGKDAVEETKERQDPFKPLGAKRASKASEEDSGSSGQSGTPERGPDGKFLPREGAQKTDKEPSEEPLDLDKASLKQILKARERVAAAKKDANDEVSKARKELDAAKAEVQRHYAELAQQRQEMERQAQAFRALKADPARAMKELGMEPESFILDLAAEGTPEGQQRRRQKEIDDQLAEIRAWRQHQAQEAQRAQQQYRQQQVEAYRAKTVKEFTELGLNEEKYPHVANFYKGREHVLMAEGDITAREYRELSGGKEGSYEDILDYIEDQLAERASKLYTNRSKANNSKQVEEQQPRKKSSGQSLSPGQSGERRSMKAKELKDLDAEERLEAAKQAVKIAIANSDRSDD